MPGQELKVALVDDHDVVRTGFRSLLESSPNLKVVADIDSGEGIYKLIGQLEVDVIVMDLSMPGMGGLEAIRRIRAKNQKVKILVFTMHESVAFVEQALAVGANGYITKNNAAKVLVEAVQKVAAGATWIDPKVSHAIDAKKFAGKSALLDMLSPREFQIFCKFAEGKSTQDIAHELSLSIKTVANYQTQIKEKLGISSTAELIKLALAHGIVTL